MDANFYYGAHDGEVGGDERGDRVVLVPHVVTLKGLPKEDGESESESEREQVIARLQLRLAADPRDTDAMYELSHRLGDRGLEHDAADPDRRALAIHPEHLHGSSIV